MRWATSHAASGGHVPVSRHHASHADTAPISLHVVYVCMSASCVVRHPWRVYECQSALGAIHARPYPSIATISQPSGGHMSIRSCALLGMLLLMSVLQLPGTVAVEGYINTLTRVCQPLRANKYQPI